MRLSLVLCLVGLLACGSVSSEASDAAPGSDSSSTDAGADAAPVAPNIVFTTSSRHTGALGGLGGADAICSMRASEAGLAGTYVAWLSNSMNDAKDRLGTASGWVRTDGLPVAASVDDLLAGNIFYPPNRDENGALVGGNVWTATRPNGTYDGASDCGNWAFASDDDTLIGNPNGGFEMFTAERTFPCRLAMSLLCFGVDREGAITPPAETGRLAFVTSGRLTGAEGDIGPYDDLCATEADNAGLGGTFLAAIAADGTPISERMDQNGDTWVRADGVKLFENATDMSDDGEMLAPIMLTIGGTPVNSDIWTMAAGFTGVNPNCQELQDPNDSGIIGQAALAGINSVSFNGATCSAMFPIYCFEQ